MGGTRGLRRDEILQQVDDEMLIVPRLGDLVTSRLARLERGRYVIEPRGLLLAAVHTWYRRLLGMETGG